MTSRLRTSSTSSATGRWVAAGVDDRCRARVVSQAPSSAHRAGLPIGRRGPSGDQPGGAVDGDGQVVEGAGRSIGRQPVGDALAGGLGQAEDGGELAVEVDEQRVGGTG